MRTKHAFRNIAMGIFSQLVIIILGFISRKIFLDNLGSEYLGINGLLTNILSAMVLIEGGLGISIVYNLYKPLAEDDKEQIIALIQLYKKAYWILAFFILVISFSFYPFLGKIMKSSGDVKGIFLVYCIFVFKSVLSYVYSYKWALINADQRGYFLAKNNLIFQVISMVLKIIILMATKNYILYLLIELILFILQNIFNSNIVNKRYNYIKTKEKYKIKKETRENIIKNVKAMFIQNIGSYAIFGTDNILISSFISVSAVGLYSNYTMIMGQLASLIGQFIGGISNSVGNLIATEDKEKAYSVFNLVYLMNFWVYSFATIFLFNLLEPFINWWLGDGYLLNNFTFIILLINFYLSGMRRTILTFKSKGGFFSQDKYAPILEGVINLITSLLFVKYFELAGIFLGTTVSYLLFSFWNQPRIVYRNLFQKRLKTYFIKYIVYLFIMLLVGWVTTNACDLIVSGYSFTSLIVRGVVCVIIPNIIYFIIFFKTKEFQYLWISIKDQMNNLNVYKVRG
ncbi:hypothetical protein M1Z83_003063 [Clostridium perfringens]